MLWAWLAPQIDMRPQHSNDSLLSETAHFVKFPWWRTRGPGGQDLALGTRARALKMAR
jgi:hypothetical protein